MLPQPRKALKSQRQLRIDVERIWKAALLAVDPEAAVRRQVRRNGSQLRVAGKLYELRKGERVWVLGAGKAAAAMGRALEKILGPYSPRGMLVTKYGHGLALRSIELLESGHPLPDANGVHAGRKAQLIAETQVRPGDLVFCLLSGGGSALLVSPVPKIDLEAKLECTQLLLRYGASIHEMNAIRKHLSNLKGGGLARMLKGARVMSLILSDVVGDDLDTIASGPLTPDSTTFQDCLAILRRLQIEDKVPECVRRRFEEGARGGLPETPKAGDPIFRQVQNVIVGNNAAACVAARSTARRLGYKSMILTSRLEGDTAECARLHMSIAAEVCASGRPVSRPACIISGGETTVHVRGTGLGGRNQEFALHCVRPLAHLAAPCLVASIGTDGSDGPTDAAGALADNSTLARSLKFGATALDDAIDNNDSYRLFQRLGDLILTGPTRTNVMDLHLVLVG